MYQVIKKTRSVFFFLIKGGGWVGGPGRVGGSGCLQCLRWRPWGWEKGKKGIATRRLGHRVWLLHGGVPGPTSLSLCPHVPLTLTTYLLSTTVSSALHASCAGLGPVRALVNGVSPLLFPCQFLFLPPFIATRAPHLAENSPSETLPGTPTDSHLQIWGRTEAFTSPRAGRRCL